VWHDWTAVGEVFTRFDQLTQAEQSAVLAGKTVASRVTLKDELLWGSVFKHEPTMSPKTLAAVFCDYDGQYRYVPGMPVTRVVNRTGKLSRVFHRINPVTFIAPGAQRSWPSWLYNRLTYSYELDEEVFSTPTEEGPGFSIRWTIPLDTQVLGARENGEIMFTQMGSGTLISYNNATGLFGHKYLKALLPSSWLARLYRFFGTIACDYYRRTVDGFLEVATQLDAAELDRDVQSMCALLENKPWSPELAAGP